MAKTIVSLVTKELPEGQGPTAQVRVRFERDGVKVTDDVTVSVGEADYVEVTIPANVPDGFYARVSQALDSAGAPIGEPSVEVIEVKRNMQRVPA